MREILKVHTQNTGWREKDDRTIVEIRQGMEGLLLDLGGCAYGRPDLLSFRRRHQFGVVSVKEIAISARHDLPC